MPTNESRIGRSPARASSEYKMSTATPDHTQDPRSCGYEPEVLVLYLKRPRAKNWELRRCGGALQIQRLEGSRPGGLWDLFLDEAVAVVCGVGLAVGALPFQLLVAERMVVGRPVGESGVHH